MNSTPGSMAQWLEQAWLERYLARELDEGEVEWFESYLVDKPHLVAAVEADADLRDGVAAAAPMQPRVASRRRPRGFTAPLALAASLATGLTLGWIFAGLQQQPAAGIMASPTRLVFDTMRGAAIEPTVYPGDPALMLVEVGVPHDASDVRLLTTDGAVPLHVNSEGFAIFLWSRASGTAAPRSVEFTSNGRPFVVDLAIKNLQKEHAQ